MEPTDQPPPASGDYARPAGAPVPARRERSRRTWLVLAALLTEAVVIAASNNHWVTEKVISWTNHHSGFLAQAVAASQSFAWRFTPPAQDTLHVWPASLVRIGVLFVVTGVLVAVLAKGLGAFWRGFVGIGLAVVFAAQVAVVASGFVFGGGTVVSRRYIDYLPTGAANNGVLYGAADRYGDASHAFFGAAGPTGETVFAGTVLAVLVGLVAGIVAWRSPAPTLVASPAQPPAPPQTFFPAPGPGIVPPGLLPPPPGPPQQGTPPQHSAPQHGAPQHGAPQHGAPPPPPPPPGAGQQGDHGQRVEETTVLPAVPDEQHTTVLPSVPGTQDTTVLPSVPYPQRTSSEDTTVFPQDPGDQGRHSS